MANETANAEQISTETRIAKLDEQVRALQDAVIRIDTATKFVGDGAKDAAKVLIAEKQVELLKEVEKLRWEFRHFERLGKMAIWLLGILTAAFAVFGIRGVEDVKRVMEARVANETNIYDSLYRGLALQAAGEFGASIEYLNRYLKSEPYDETAIAAIFRSYIETEDSASAHQLIVNLKAAGKFDALHQPLTWNNMASSLLPDAVRGNPVMREVNEYFDRAIRAARPGDEEAHYWIYRNACVAAWLDGDSNAASDYIERLGRMSPNRTVPPWKEFSQWVPLRNLAKENPQMMSTAARQWDRLKDRYRSGS